MFNEICPVCKSELYEGYQPWHFLCKICYYEKANLQPTINLNSAHSLIDENAREMGLKRLRINNFQKILEHIKFIKPNGGRLLDVGCAHGWFLETAKNHFDVFGLEPDKIFNTSNSKSPFPIRIGYFPEALDENEKFDIIIFNDVIEHIPAISHTIESCYNHLNQDGLLVLNLPSSNGVFYKISKLCCLLGFNKFFDRLWQKDLPSPHLHYFNLSNIAPLLLNNCFDIKVKGRLSTICLPGLYTRISYTSNFGVLSRALIYAGIVLTLPILKILPQDIIYVISSRK